MRIWSIQEKSEEDALQGHTDEIHCIGITSDNKFIVSGSADMTLRIWNFKEKTQETVLKDEDQRLVSSLAITSDNKYIVSGSLDYNVWVLL